MDACIFLDGAALWVATGLFIFLFIGFIYMGNCYINSEKKVENISHKFKLAKADLRAMELELEIAKMKLKK